ncbi:MAG: carboxypeptidase-like regulatory domain-containing protein [Isosphaerales bacterium]
MTTLFGPILAMALVAQFHGGTLQGTVVDDQGKPVADAQVVFHAPAPGGGKVQPVEVRTKTDAAGRYRLTTPSLGGVYNLRARVWAYRAGTAITAAPVDRSPPALILRKPEPRTVKIEGPDGQPVAGASVSPRVVSFAAGVPNTDVPDTLAAPRALTTGPDGDLQSLATADPAGVLRKLEEVEFLNAVVKSRIQGQVARALARTDPIKAAAVAESIEEPNARALALVVVADALPERERDRKLALLDAAALQAKAATDPIWRFYHMGEVAERWYELGEKDKAKTLFADGLRLANQTPRKKDPRRGSFAARLARVDLPSALAIAKEFPAGGKEFPTGGMDSASRILENIAFRLAADNPAEAERVLRQIPQEAGRDWLPPAIAWKMATIDPARAQRLVEESQRFFDHPEMYLFLALGLKSRDEAAAHRAFQTAMQGIDRLTKEGAGYRSTPWTRGVLLPLVEQIDPALVPELFWHAVAMRPPIGNPRATGELWNRVLVVLLAWYDRDVAAALFEPIRVQMEDDDLVLARSPEAEFWGWSIFDPRAAVARLEKVPVSPRLGLDADYARRPVSETLGLPHEARSRRIWSMYTDMSDLFGRDLR